MKKVRRFLLKLKATGINCSKVLYAVIIFLFNVAQFKWIMMTNTLIIALFVNIMADFTTEMASGPTKCSALFVYLNIVSLDKHFGDLKLFLNRFAKKVEVLCISETRLTDSKVKFCELPGYNLYYCNSNTSASGSAIYVTDNIKCQPLSQTKIKVNGCEDVWVELTLENNGTLIVDSVNRHPISTISGLRTFEDAFVSIIKSFKTNQKHLVLSDLNIHHDKMDTSKHIADYTR